MIAKIQPTRKHTSSAKRLQEYLTTERRSLAQETEQSVEILQNGLDKPAPNATLKRKLRGDVVLSSDLLGLDTSAYEMEGVAANNPRCKDPILHYELAWPHDEHPTKEQWKDSALQTLEALGYAEHQYLIAAHEDKKHFHIHVMVNTVHQETFRVNNPHQSWTILDKTTRKQEAIYGWKRTPGLTRWDDEAQEAIRLKRSERQAAEHASLRPTSSVARFEHYNDVQSLQTYIRREVAPSARNVLSRKNVQWNDLHTLLAKAHLRLEKRRKGRVYSCCR